MRKIFGILLIFVFVMTLFSADIAGAVKVYTFKKDRVDQSLGGNRGYITGRPEGLAERTETPQMTLFGMDVEVPAKFWPTVSSEKTHFRKSTKPSKKEPVGTEESMTVVGDETEEEWIK
ncbi:hypothetical protein ACFL5E_04370 [Candidatus Omnitrophota bacterium]